MKRISLRVSDEVHEYLRKQSFTLRTSINTIITEALEQLAREEARSEEMVAKPKRGER